MFSSSPDPQLVSSDIAGLGSIGVPQLPPGRNVRRMSDGTKGDQDLPAQSDPSKDPSKPVEEWVTGDEPMTGPQRSYLETLAREAGEPVPADLTKAQASELIDQLQQRTGRGT